MELNTVTKQAMENLEDTLRVLQSHERCMHFDIQDGETIFCGVVNMHRLAHPTAEGWFCKEHRTAPKVLNGSLMSTEEYLASGLTETTMELSLYG